VLGATGSGKTTLLRRILYGGVDGRGDGAPPKPGEGMEYHYARRARGGESDRKDVAHVWEISGRKAFAEAITSKESVFFGARQVTTGTALICIDLSKPSEAVPTLEYFLSRVRLAVDRTFDKLRKRGSRLPEQLVNRHKKQFKAASAISEKCRARGLCELSLRRRHHSRLNLPRRPVRWDFDGRTLLRCPDRRRVHEGGSASQRRRRAEARFVARVTKTGALQRRISVLRRLLGFFQCFFECFFFTHAFFFCRL
jgi:hypothetical protein